MTNPVTLLCPERLNSLTNQLRSVMNLPGDVLELGVYKGGSLAALAQVIHSANLTEENKKTLFGIDTFTGIPSQWEGIDVHKKGDFADTSHEAISEMLNPFSFVKVLKEYFPAENSEVLSAEKVCFAHFDGDQYESCRDFLDFLRDRLVVGGLIVFDDYDWGNCPGVTRAVHEFLGHYPLEYVVNKRVTMQVSIRRLRA